ncbi:MAG: hypothetical protein JNK22_07960 [Rhodocyclaceae bacterium]|nr:hypothetical protein [Rhodocyclaceae bacterium]
MIRIEECEALLERRPGWESELACRECLAAVPAYADPHGARVCADHFGDVPAGAGTTARRPHVRAVA